MALRNIKRRTALNGNAAIAALRVIRPVKKATSKSSSPSEISIDLKQPKEYKEVTEQLLRPFFQRERSAIPADLKPMLASIINAPFNDEDWQFEIKWDGYRALAYIENGQAELRSRNNLSFNQKYPTVINALNQWPVNAVVDGEITVLSEEGKAQFGVLQNWHETKEGTLIYYAFDLLWLEGIDLKNEPLIVRRTLLRKIIPEGSIIRYSDSIDECGIDFFNTAKANGLEGIIAKQKQAPYYPGNRSKTWYKIKAETRHEAIICGYTKKKDSDRLISSLLLEFLKMEHWNTSVR